jgi:hypothetical protein
MGRMLGSFLRKAVFRWRMISPAPDQLPSQLSQLRTSQQLKGVAQAVPVKAGRKASKRQEVDLKLHDPFSFPTVSVPPVGRERLRASSQCTFLLAPFFPVEMLQKLSSILGVCIHFVVLVLFSVAIHQHGVLERRCSGLFCEILPPFLLSPSLICRRMSTMIASGGLV